MTCPCVLDQVKAWLSILIRTYVPLQMEGPIVHGAQPTGKPVWLLKAACLHVSNVGQTVLQTVILRVD